MAVLPPDPVFSLKGDMGFVHCLCFPPPFGGTAPNRLLAGTEAGFLYIWNLESNRIQHKFEVGPSILSVQHIENTMITQEKMGLIKIWRRDNECQYTHMTTLQSGLGFCRCIISEGKFLASAQENSVVEIFDLNTHTIVSKFEPPADDKLGNVMCLRHLDYHGNDYILAGYETGDLLMWDPKNDQKCMSRLKLRECLTTVDFDVSCGRGVTGNASKHLQVFNIDRAQHMSLKCELAMTNDGCNVVRIRKDKKVFVSGGWDGHVRIYSWRSLRPLAVLTEHKQPVTDVVFSQAPVASWGTMLMAVTGQDGRISLWDLYN